MRSLSLRLEVVQRGERDFLPLPHQQFARVARRHEHLVHEPAGDADFRDTVDDIFQNTFDSRDHARRILRRTRAI